MRRAVFLDRDGTLNEDVGYPRRFEAIHVFPESFEAVRLLNQADFLVIVVTNQSGIGRGLLTEAELVSIHQKMASLFQERGARIDAFYYCPHWIESFDPRYRQVCSCRKPGVGMGEKAALDFQLDLNQCFMIGDKLDDILFGRRLGARSILVLTGQGRQTLETISWFKNKDRSQSSPTSPQPLPGSNGENRPLKDDSEEPLLSSDASSHQLILAEDIPLKRELLEPAYVALNILEAVKWVLATLNS